MALPATVGTDSLWAAHKNTRIGPFESGGNLYTVIYNTSGTMHVYKSSDGGDTWASQGSLASSSPKDTVQVGTALYILYAATSSLATVVKFECSTDTLQSLETGMTTSRATLVNNVAGESPGFLVVRGAGDYVVFHNGATETVMGTAYRRAKYSRFQSGAWTINVDVGGIGDQAHKDSRAAVGGSSSRSHFFYTKSTAR